MNISSDTVLFEHEVFAKERMLSMTLSGLSKSEERQISTLDNFAYVNVTTLTRNIGFVAEILAKHAFGFHGRDFSVFEGSLQPDHLSIEEWLRILTRESRVDPLLPKTKGKSTTLSFIRERFLDYTEQSDMRKYALPNGLYFRDYAPTVMYANLVRGPFFDLFIFIFVILYLGAWFFATQYIKYGEVDFSVIKTFLDGKKKK